MLWFGRRALALLLPLLAACEPKPSILLISVDSLRADAVSVLGDRAHTPNIDALAAAGTVFTQAVATTPWPGGSLANVMTGQSSRAHKRRIPDQRLDRSVPTLAESLAAAGYYTSAVVSFYDFDRVFEMDRGFHDYDDRFTDAVHPSTYRVFRIQSLFYGLPEEDRRMRARKLANDSMRHDSSTTDAALGWLRRRRSGDFFLWVHYFGGHERIEDPFNLAQQPAKYRAAIEAVDGEIGRLLRWLVDAGLHRSTLIILHGTQGQELMEHGSFGHGGRLYEESIRVPLILSLHGVVPHGKRVDRLVSLDDIAPSIIAAAGIRRPPPMRGHSLLTAPPAPNPVYLETWIPATVFGAALEAQRGTDLGFVRRGLRDERWKYIRSESTALVDASAAPASPLAPPQEELYDLSSDPAERVNLALRDPERLGQMRRALEERMAGEQR